MGDITKLTEEENAVTNEFHKLYYPFFTDTTWLGVTALKCPFDLFVYQELIVELRPDLIIECGTAEGGSAVYLASICELIGHGSIVTIDLQFNKARPRCPRVTYWEGDTLSPDILKRAEELAVGKESVMVILDDDHSCDHVLQELRAYSRFVTPGGYLIVEDTNVNGHPVFPEFGPGPMEAVELFMRESNVFEVDRSREKFLVSFNPRGYLKKHGQSKSPNHLQATGRLLPLADKVRIQNELILSQGEQLTSLQRTLAHQGATLQSVLNSKGWKLLNRYRDAKAQARGLLEPILRKPHQPFIADGEKNSVDVNTRPAIRLDSDSRSASRAKDSMTVDTRTMYLELLKKSLTFTLYAPKYLDVRQGERLEIDHPRDSDLQDRVEGRDWPYIADTMVGLKRLNNLQSCVDDLLTRDIPGDMIECGVWRGGTSIFLRALLKTHGINDRRVWVADSFEGLPAPNPQVYPDDHDSTLHQVQCRAVSLDEVQQNFSRYGVLDDSVRFLKGWFRDTLPTLSTEKWALIRLDGDMYESTINALDSLYPHLSPGGYIVIDDYGAIPACRKAVHDYRDANGIKEEIKSIDWTGVFWRREL